jgi:membrane protease YdiL (CAAX protease family)
MGTAKIKASFLLKAIATLIVIELILGSVAAWTNVPHLLTLAFARAIEIFLFLVLAKRSAGGMNVIGLSIPALWPGVKKGLFWSAGFGFVAILLFFIFFMMDRDPFAWIRSPVPGKLSDFLLLLLVAGIIAPVAEEIFFRGIVYGYLRRFGVIAAVILSTSLFAAIHLGPTIPVTQIVGGLVFAIAYEKEDSLMAPIMIHILGNLAIFCLSLPDVLKNLVI